MYIYPHQAAGGLHHTAMTRKVSWPAFEVKRRNFNSLCTAAQQQRHVSDDTRAGQHHQALLNDLTDRLLANVYAPLLLLRILLQVVPCISVKQPGTHRVHELTYFQAARAASMHTSSLHRSRWLGCLCRQRVRSLLLACVLHMI